MTVAILVVVALVAAGRGRRISPRNTWGRLCSGCGTYVQNFARFCPHCGRRKDNRSQR